MSEKIILALPSKGRLMEDCNALFARAGYKISKAGAARGYRGIVEGRDDIDVHSTRRRASWCDWRRSDA